MNATLTAINGFLLALSWFAEQGTSYTVQTSRNLTDWATLPHVFAGLDAAETLTIDATPSPVFVRLRYNTSGDTNDNGLPDTWELQTFGRLDINALDDPDEDGSSTYVEWLNGTDPLDFFDGRKPVIHLSCGSDWIVPEDTRSSQCISLTLLNASGQPFANAPVTLRLQSRSNALLQVEDPVEAAVANILAYTDNLGRIHPALHAIQYAAMPGNNPEDTLIIQAGEAAVEIRIHVVPGEGGGPPREVKRSFPGDGTTLFTWRGDAHEARSFRVEEQAASGKWMTILELAAGEIPTPDALTGLYTCLTDTP